MGSNIEQSYEASPLANLSKAFEATWEVLHARDSSPNAGAEDDLRLAVAGKLLELAADGLTDPEELRDRVLVPRRKLAPFLDQTQTSPRGRSNGEGHAVLEKIAGA